MADEGSGEILWFRPDPRAIIPLDGFHISRSLARTLRRGVFEIRVDTDFEGVMRGCARRPEGTWISERFVEVYGALYRAGYDGVVSVEHEDRSFEKTQELVERGFLIARDALRPYLH